MRNQFNIILFLEEIFMTTAATAATASTADFREDPDNIVPLDLRYYVDCLPSIFKEGPCSTAVVLSSKRIFFQSEGDEYARLPQMISTIISASYRIYYKVMDDNDIDKALTEFQDHEVKLIILSGIGSGGTIELGEVESPRLMSYEIAKFSLRALHPESQIVLDSCCGSKAGEIHYIDEGKTHPIPILSLKDGFQKKLPKARISAYPDKHYGVISTKTSHGLEFSFITDNSTSEHKDGDDLADQPPKGHDAVASCGGGTASASAETKEDDWPKSEESTEKAPPPCPSVSCGAGASGTVSSATCVKSAESTSPKKTDLFKKMIDYTFNTTIKCNTDNSTSEHKDGDDLADQPPKGHDAVASCGGGTASASAETKEDDWPKSEESTEKAPPPCPSVSCGAGASGTVSSATCVKSAESTSPKKTDLFKKMIDYTFNTTIKCSIAFHFQLLNNILISKNATPITIRHVIFISFSLSQLNQTISSHFAETLLRSDLRERDLSKISCYAFGHTLTLDEGHKFTNYSKAILGYLKHEINLKTLLELFYSYRKSDNPEFKAFFDEISPLLKKLIPGVPKELPTKD